MMPGRGVLSTIARRFVYSRPDGDGASQSVGVSRQPYRNPGSNLGRNPDQLPSAPSAMESGLPVGLMKRISSPTVNFVL